MSELFPRKKKTIKREYDQKEIEFTIQELRGIEADQIIDDCKDLSFKTDKKKPTMSLSMAQMNKGRLLRSVIESKLDGKPFDFKTEFDNLPRSVYNWLVKEIDSFNGVSEEEEKN